MTLWTLLKGVGFPPTSTSRLLCLLSLLWAVLSITLRQANYSVFRRKRNKSKNFTIEEKDKSTSFPVLRIWNVPITIISDPGSQLTPSLTSSPALLLFWLAVFHDTFSAIKIDILAFPHFFSLSVKKKKIIPYFVFLPSQNLNNISAY